MRKLVLLSLIITTAVLGIGAGTAHAWVRDDVWGPRVFIGPSWFPPQAYLYPYPNGYSPPVVAERAPKLRFYVESQQAPPEQSFWFFCEKAKAYYPYVAECPEGWLPLPSPASGALPPAGLFGQPDPGAFAGASQAPARPAPSRPAR